jgi:DNA-binding HxlR family transcriptional regulator
MLGRTYDTQICSVAGALELVGERWTLLIVRDVFLGHHRFEDLQRRLGVARNILTARLNRLVGEGVLERRRYDASRERHEYHLTGKGLDLWPVIVALMSWGDRYVYPGRPPLLLAHRGCGGTVSDRRTCRECGVELEPDDVVAERGPGRISAEV